jgi:hypothetical protein
MGVARVHRHRARRIPRSGLVAFELVVDWWPRGWMLIGRPSSRVLDERGFVEVTRVAVEEGLRNACSMFYGVAARWAWKARVPIVTYTLATESGASLRGAGWVEVGRTPPPRSGGWDNREGSSTGDGAEKIRWSPKWCSFPCFMLSPKANSMPADDRCSSDVDPLLSENRTAGGAIPHATK